MMQKYESNKENLRYVLWKNQCHSPQPLCIFLPEEKDSQQTMEEKVKFFLSESFQEQHPCWVLLPQQFGGWDTWEQALELHELLFDLDATESSLDGYRMYLLGGTGAWEVASRFPTRFAAVAAFSGPKNPYRGRALKFLPLWAFEGEHHGAKREWSVLLDEEGTFCRKAVMALRTCGGEKVRFTHLSNQQENMALWCQAIQETDLLSWLFSQNRRKEFTVHYLRPGVFRIDDYFTSSAYLVCGTEKALLIDTGMGEGDLAGLAHSLTSLPIEVAITHCHEDHMAHASCFSRVWMQKDDLKSMLKDQETWKHLKSHGFNLPRQETLLPLENGSCIDLGGGVVLETLELPGHTSHSLIFVDNFHQSIFTGDAIGSGYIALIICPWEEWKKRIITYRQSLESILEKLPAWENYAWYGGHFIQENGCDLRRQEWYRSGKSQYFNPISGQVIQDMTSLCTMLLEGIIPEEELKQDPEHHAQWREAGINFRFI